MCGGFVAIYACSGPGAARRSVLGHATYSAGRLAAYLVVGGIFGTVGSAVNRAGSLAGIRGAATWIAGGVMIVWGTGALLRALDVPLPAPRFPTALARLVSRVLGSFRERPPAVRALLLGLSSALLPCGWLYAFAVVAAGTGSPVSGVVVMLAFWAGTLPVMLVSGVTLQALSAPLRRRVPAVSAALLILIGVLWLTGFSLMPGGGHSSGPDGHRPPASAQDSEAEAPTQLHVHP
jgi:sulfite exporter TauE/SafE